MRPNALLHLALLICIAACSAHRASDAGSSASPSPTATPSPLQSCETREVDVDGVDLILQANVDGTLATASVVHAPDDASRAQALADIQRAYGEAHVDTRRFTHTTKYGFPVQTDLCGHPVSPSPNRST